MKRTLLFIFAILGTSVFAQEHFSGINTSRRVGLLNAEINPAQLTSLKGKYEVNIFNFSVNVANNKMTFGDLVGGNDNFEEMLFAGSEPLNMRADVEILGPAFAFRYEKWAFAISSSAKIKASLVDVNTTLGNAVTNGGVENVSEVYEILASENQRATGTSWGEIGLSIAREVYDTEEHRISVGATFKLLFPGTYANMGASEFEGTIENNFGDVRLTDANAEVNFAYSGSLAGDFSETGNFTEFFAGGLNGFSTDIGVNYQWKAIDSTRYKLNAGLAIRNLGSMTFKDDNNESTNYSLDVPAGSYLDLNQFEDAESIQDVEDILLASGYLTMEQASKDFKVKLPAILSGYADVNIYGNWYATAYIQQRMNEDNDNDQIAVQNIISITPRYSTGFFEAYTPLADNEISGFTAGIGVRLGGFFIGSGSALSAMLGDTNQADAYMGFRVGF
ncbi:hypothetical protein E0W68_08430 [Flavobacterium salilacus subsp. salilacus]|uniref:hypothetical protein n=1 Tax=Flavobacterium TaxID=237 RepID=UPI0010751032|nr:MULTISPECIES: hypothetical protein [Flavobacterium]KAF2518766.1 hypothetical protein E0W68_08430 [Flavobacterium salilacus subsp. salilacus]MBE1613734.1 hypothetical protein [Flavobacterium sp. SaA2.13]